MNVFNNLVVTALPLTPKPVIAYFAKPYIAGATLAEGTACVRRLNAEKTMATMDVLGEDVFTREEAIAGREECKKVLAEIAAQKLDSNISLKLTQLGLKIDKSFCLANVDDIVASARSYGNFVRIDMEDNTTTDDTLEIFRAVKSKYDNVGIVIQAYLKRSEDDIRKLAAEKANVRLCKGIYVEPADIAFTGRREIQQNYVRLLKILFEGGSYVGIATHDDVLISSARQIVSDLTLTPQQYEFQMLLGVRPERRRELVAEGHRMRVYTPFGSHWYAYSVRRLKENPQMAGHVFKAILGIR